MVWVRILDPSDYGIYSLTISTALLLQTVFFEWLRQSWSRNLLSDDKSGQVSNQRASALVRIVLLVSLVILLAGVVLYRSHIALLSLEPVWWIPVSVYAVAEAWIALGNVTLRYRDKPGRFFIQVFGRAACGILAGSAFFYLSGGQLWALMAGLLSTHVIFAIVAVSEKFWLTAALLKPDASDFKTLISFGIPLIFGVTLNYCTVFVDRLVIQQSLDATALGFYSAPTDLVQRTLVFILLLVNMTGYPLAVRAQSTGGVTAGQKQLRKNLALQIALGLPAVFGLATLAPGLSRLAFQPEYQSVTSSILPFVAGAAFFRSLSAFYCNSAFQLAGKPSLSIASPLIAVSVVVLAGPWTAANFGIEGISVLVLGSSAMSFLIGLLLSAIFYDRRPLSVEFIQVFVASFVMACALWTQRSHDSALDTILLTAVGVAIYFCVLALFNTFGLRTKLGNLRVGLDGR